MTLTPAQQYELLLDGIRLLALPAVEQVAALPGFVVVTDELLLTFYDGYLLVPQLEEARVISRAAAVRLGELNSWLDSAPNDGSIEEASSLAVHSFWTRSRELARCALEAMDEPICTPKFQGVAWVKG